MSNYEQFIGTRPVAPQHAFDQAALARYLRERIDGFGSDLAVEQFKGGQSNPTFMLTAGGRRYVLRRKPPGQLLPSAHAVDREFRVQSALAATAVPVPRMLHLCEDRAVIGTLFYVMEALDGRVVHDSSIPGATPPERAAMYDAMNEVLARLHEVGWRAVGLESFGRPGNYFARQIARWTRAWHASKTREIPELDLLAEWLPRGAVVPFDTAALHRVARDLLAHPPSLPVTMPHGLRAMQEATLAVYAELAGGD